MPPERRDPEERKPSTHGFGQVSLPPAFDLALRWGLTLAVSVFLGFLIGRWLDVKLKTTPLFLLIGVFWGLGGSFYSVFLQIKKLEKDDQTAEATTKPREK